MKATQRKIGRILFDEFHSESWSISQERAREMQPARSAHSSYPNFLPDLCKSLIFNESRSECSK